MLKPPSPSVACELLALFCIQWSGKPLAGDVIIFSAVWLSLSLGKFAASDPAVIPRLLELPPRSATAILTLE